MRRRLRSLVSALEHARHAVDPRAQPVSVPVVHHTHSPPVEVPEFDDPGQLSAAELKQLRDELRDELSRAAFTSDPPKE